MTSRRNPARVMFGLLPLCFALAWSHSPICSAATVTDQYDARIKTAIGTWWPALPAWKLGKAQLMAESNLDPAACSAVGACGLAQFMGPSWNDMVKALNLGAVSPHDADAAIKAYAYYQGKLDWQWRRDRDPLQAHWLGVPSYNAGLGNILKAQDGCHGARLWPEVSPCLVLVTGPKNSEETRTYVTRIERYWHQLELLP